MMVRDGGTCNARHKPRTTVNVLFAELPTHVFGDWLASRIDVSRSCSAGNFLNSERAHVRVTCSCRAIVY